jgi:hypothetical protein
MHVHHEVVAYLPGKWTIRDDEVHVVDQSFEYTSTTRFRDGRLDLDYDLRNTRDHVPVAQLDQFLDKLGKVHDDAFFTLTDRHRPPATARAQLAARASSPPNIVFVIGVLVGAGLGARLALYFWKLDAPLPPAQPYAPEGLRGWLAVIAFQVILAPPMLVYAGYSWAEDLGPSAVFNALSTACQYLVFCVVLFMAAMFTASLAQLALFFLKRNSFRRLFIVMNLAWLALYLLSLGVLYASQSDEQAIASHFWDLVSTALSLVIWIPYILVSQRVRATFRAGRGTGYRRTRVLGGEAAATASGSS